MKDRWSIWRAFPDPRQGDYLHAPLGAGVYELRDVSTDRLVLVGISGHLAHRMSSLLPSPLGCGGRNNTAKRKYLADNLSSIRYRTKACGTREEAAELERALLRSRDYLFPT